jgi:hypothetical protein
MTPRILSIVPANGWELITRWQNDDTTRESATDRVAAWALIENECYDAKGDYFTRTERKVRPLIAEGLDLVDPTTVSGDRVTFALRWVGDQTAGPDVETGGVMIRDDRR